MINSLSQKVAIVTGASRGIGRSIAIKLAEYGAKVVVCYVRNGKDAENVVQVINSNGGAAYPMMLDVTDRVGVKEKLIDIYDMFGKIDILINNAGYLQQKPFSLITDDDWDFTFNVNLKSIFVTSQEVFKYFEKARSGCIINLASVGGQIGGHKAPHYAASKAGVISITRSTARLYAEFGVRVNAISPGFIKTSMYEDILKRENSEEINAGILLNRPGDTNEVASVAAFLASDDASYITGQVINVNGGSFLG